jgi:nitrate/nitrite transporter NarK
MGIWATWVPVGTVAAYWLAPSLAAQYGWASVWWLTTGFTLFVLAIYVLLIRMPPAPDSAVQAARPPASGGSLLAALNNRDIWLIALSFACFNLAFVSLGTYYPAFLSGVRGYPMNQAAFIASLGTLVVLVSAPLAGWLSDRIGSRKLVMAIPFLLIGVSMLFPFRVTGWQLYALMIFQGLVAGAAPTATFAAAPEVMRRPEWAGLGMAVVLVGQNLGQLIGPLAFGQAVSALGWVTAGYLLIPFCILGFFAAWMVRVR